MRLNMRLFHGMGIIHYGLSRGKKDALKKVLRQVLPDAPEKGTLDAHVLDYFINHYMDRMSIFHYHRLDAHNMSQVITFQGLELLREALDRGKGCVLVHGHLGPSQLPLVALGQLGYPMTQLGFRSTENLSRIGRDVQMRIRLEIEERFPAHMLYVDQMLRPVYRNLARNGVVMVAGDGAGGARQAGRRQSVPFMRGEALFPTGPYKLAFKSQAALLFLFLVRDGKYRYRAVITRPEASPDREGEEAVLRCFVRQLEHHIRRDPGQWQFWDGFMDHMMFHGAVPVDTECRPSRPASRDDRSP